MPLFDDLQKEYIQARKNRDKFVSDVLSMFMSDLKYLKINEKKELDDSTVISFLSKTIKQKKDAASDYEKAGRQDLLEKERKEIEFLSRYLPPELSDEELSDIVKQSQAEIGASSPSDMGKLMKAVMSKVRGRADGARVKKLVTDVLKA